MDNQGEEAQNIIWGQKATHWEITKGYLRGMVGLIGAVPSTSDDNRWEELKERVEKFIKEVEDDGLQE